MNTTTIFRFSSRLAASVAIGLVPALAGPVHAAETGGTVYPNGADNFTAGAMPPPGIYGMVFAEHYSADRVNDANGNNLNVPGFKVRADAVVPRFIWVTGVNFLGGDLSLHALAPIVNLKVSAAGRSQTNTGIGDITLGPGLGYHHSANLHSLIGLDFYLPTGHYDKNDLANIGRNYYAIEPLYILSYVDPKGFNGDIKAGYIFNQRNKDTGYRSGQEFHFDYAAGWGLGNGWTVGVGGYYYQQTTPDRQAGIDLVNSKGRTFAVGPSVKYDSGKGWFATLKWQKEVRSENRAQGNALWLKAVFPL
ncbi:MAG: transporter [Variovorax sp.]